MIYNPSVEKVSVMLQTTGARLGTALLGYFTLVILLFTLNPFYLAWSGYFQISFIITADDIIQNVILFLPIGYLYRVTGGEHRRAILLGLVLTASVELLQLFIPARTASPNDVLANTFGAALGSWLYDRLAARIAMTPMMVGRLALEIPLMGLIYILVPLLWINVLALDESPIRWPLTLLIGGCGALILSDIYRAWGGRSGIRFTWRVALTGGAWFLLGSGPGIMHIFPTVPLTIGVSLLTGILAALPWQSKERRFERTTIMRISPIFGVYLILLALWPPLRPLGAWHGMIALTDRIEPLLAYYPTSLLEYLAAFTVLGFITAEWRGRAEIPLLHDIPQLLWVSFGSAFVLEILVGFQVGYGASLIRLVLVVVGALFGGMIYHLQRDHVRFLLRARDAQAGRL